MITQVWKEEEKWEWKPINVKGIFQICQDKLSFFSPPCMCKEKKSRCGIGSFGSLLQTITAFLTWEVIQNMPKGLCPATISSLEQPNVLQQELGRGGYQPPWLQLRHRFTWWRQNEPGAGEGSNIITFLCSRCCCLFWFFFQSVAWTFWESSNQASPQMQLSTSITEQPSSDSERPVKWMKMSCLMINWPCFRFMFLLIPHQEISL